MPEHLLTEVQLKKLFFDTMVAVTGLDGGGEIRWAFAQDGQPGWKIGTNMVSLNLSIADDPTDKLRDIVYQDSGDPASLEESISYTTVLSLDCYCYGPLSFDISRQIKSGILKPAARDILRVEKVYPIPRIQAPVKVAYLFEGQWWQRYDLRILFNAHNVEVETISTIAAVRVDVVTESGTERSINIPD